MTGRRSTKRIGELLVQRGLISAEQLEQALAEQRSTREFLGAMLIRQGVIQPEALLEVLSEQFGIPHESLTPQDVDWRVVKQFPASVLAEGRCFPIRASEETVTVAVANPLDAWGLSAIEKAEAARFRKIETVLVLERELQVVYQAYKQRSLRAIEERLTHHGRDEA